MKEPTNFTKCLSDQNRLKILRLLMERDMCVCEMMEVLKAPQSRVSKHLQRLRADGLVEDRRESKWVVYSLNEKVFRKKMKGLRDIFFGDSAKSEAMKLEFTRLDNLENRDLLRRKLRVKKR